MSEKGDRVKKGTGPFFFNKMDLSPFSPHEELSRRLPWLLVFRAFVATGFLCLTWLSMSLAWPIKLISGLMYGVAGSSFVVVLALALLLRVGVSPVVLSAIHVMTSVVAAFLLVEGSGGIESPFTFMYVLCCIDGAIIGGRVVALTVATACSLSYGMQISFGSVADPWTVPWRFDADNPDAHWLSLSTHTAAFYLVAWLAGYLGDLWQSAQVAVQHAKEEVRHLEQELVAQERMAAVGKMAAAIAHELRNPLASISGCIELLHKAGDDKATRDRLRDIVLREVDRLNTLINDFLVYARPSPPVRTVTDVASLVRETCLMFQHNKSLTDYPLHVFVPSRLEARVDAAQLQQVVWNLVGNAVDASPERTPVVVRVRMDADPGARSVGDRGRGMKTRSMVALEITDSGVGVSEDMRIHLFEPFHTNKPGGTGLGLAIVRRIVEAHGGTVTLLARESGGTMAYVRIPVDTENGR